MALMQVLLGHAALGLLPLTFSERPPLSQPSLQIDAAQDQTSLEDFADPPRAMNVFSRGGFEAFLPNASSLAEQQARPTEQCPSGKRDSGGNICCDSSVLGRLSEMEAYQNQSVIDLTHVMPGCDCLCGKLGTWAPQSAQTATTNGIQPAYYTEFGKQTKHRINPIQDGRDVEYEQINLLAHYNALKDNIKSKITSPPDHELLTNVLDHFGTYSEAMVQNNGASNLGIWNKKVEALIKTIPDSEWGESKTTSGVHHVKPRENQPVMEYQIDLLTKRGKESGDIEACIEGLGIWKAGADYAQLLTQHGLTDRDAFGSAGPPEAGAPVHIYQEKIFKDKGVWDTVMEQYVQGRKGGGPMAANLKGQLFDDQWKDQKYWDFKSGVALQVTGGVKPKPGAREACWKDPKCCTISKKEGDNYAVGIVAPTGSGESENILRSMPPQNALMTIEVAMNFQGRLEAAPMIWKAGAGDPGEAATMRGLSGFNCQDSPCNCGCTHPGGEGICGDPFANHPPVAGELVTAEQASVFYFYKKDIYSGTGAHLVEPGKHWKWTGDGLMWLSMKKVDLPGADIESPGPLEDDIVTPYQLHYLEEQQGLGLTGKPDEIADFLKTKKYIKGGSPGLKPCATKNADNERPTRNMAAIKETDLILNKNNAKSSDAPLVKAKPWTNRADVVTPKGIVTGNSTNLNPHSGQRGFEIPKTMAYADILNYLRYTEQLRKEKDFAEEIKKYWLKGYYSWKLNQDVRQLENQYFKNLYLSSKAASEIVKKEYQVDNRLTNSVTHIIENERNGETGQDNDLKYLFDHDDDSKLGQVQALNATPNEDNVNGGPLLTKKEIQVDHQKYLGRFAATVATVGKNGMAENAKRGFTAIMPGEMIRLKVSTNVANMLHAVPTVLQPYIPNFSPGSNFADRDVAGYEFKLMGYRVKKNAKGVPDCDFDRTIHHQTEDQKVLLMSKFNRYITVNERNAPELQLMTPEVLSGRTRALYWWTLTSIKRWKSDGEDARKLQEVASAIGPWGGDLGTNFQSVAAGYGPEPRPGDWVEQQQLSTIARVIGKDAADQLWEPGGGDKKYLIESVRPGDFQHNYLSWRGGGVSMHKNPSWEPTEGWSVDDDGKGGLAIMAYDPSGKWFNPSAPRTDVTKKNVVDRSGTLEIENGGGRNSQPWMILTPDFSPACKTTVDLEVQDKEDGKWKDIRSISSVKRNSQALEYLNKLEGQDFQAVQTEWGSSGSVDYELAPIPAVLEYVLLPKSPTTDTSKMEKIAEFLRGPWIVKNGNKNSGVEVLTKYEKMGSPAKTDIKLLKFNGKPVWSTSGHLDMKDLLKAGKTRQGDIRAPISVAVVQDALVKLESEGGSRLHKNGID